MFAHIVDQLPGTSFDGRDYRLLAFSSEQPGGETYLLVIAGARCTVFALDTQQLQVIPNVEHGMSPWKWLCQVCTPAEGSVKSLRLSMDMDRRLHQGARNFVGNVSHKFDMWQSWSLMDKLRSGNG